MLPPAVSCTRSTSPNARSAGWLDFTSTRCTESVISSPSSSRCLISRKALPAWPRASLERMSIMPETGMPARSARLAMWIAASAWPSSATSCLERARARRMVSAVYQTPRNPSASPKRLARIQSAPAITMPMTPSVGPCSGSALRPCASAVGVGAGMRAGGSAGVAAAAASAEALRLAITNTVTATAIAATAGSHDADPVAAINWPRPLRACPRRRHVGRCGCRGIRGTRGTQVARRWIRRTLRCGPRGRP